MKYNSFANLDGIYFVTFATVGWIDVFTRNRYREIFLESIKYCQYNKGLKVHAWCLMSNHVHLIISRSTVSLSDIMRDMKKFTATTIIKSIEEEPESRREWLLYLFKYYANINPNNEINQFWQQDNKIMELYSAKFIDQKINYIHQNPVENGIIETAESYLWASAKDYAGEKGKLEIVII